MIAIRNVTKEFDVNKQKVTALSDVNFTIEKGDIFGIIGFSGAGKSTLLRMINALEVPTSGHVEIDGVNINGLSFNELRKVRKRIGMVFQQFNLLNAKSVYDNVAIPLILNKVPKSEIDKKVKTLLDFVDLGDKANAYPGELSGGQKQRVAIARALANDPKILISDESTSALDPKTTKQILALLQGLNKKLGLTIVLITHEMQIVKDIANRVAVMQNGELIEEGSVLDIFSNPKNALTQDFITVATGIDEAMVKINQQAIVKNLPDDSILAHLKYAGSVTDTAIINDIYKQYQVSANILFGNIEILDNTPVGELVVILSGENQNLETAKAELENAGVSVTIVKDGRKA